MRAVSGIAAVTTAAAIVHAVRAMGVSRIALATPYQEATNRHEIAFLEACGIATVASSALGVKVGGSLGYSGISETPLETIREQARGVMHPDAQALVVSCTDYPVLTLIPELERELGVPVITSTTATLWAALRAVGIDDAVPGAGRLLGR
jgi:maleate isomerase/arylmalonate decarboxylase